MPQSPSKQVTQDFTQFSQHRFQCSKHSEISLLESPSAAPLYFPESHRQCEISSLLKFTLVSGKARSFSLLQTVHIQHSQVFCFLHSFQNLDHFRQTLDHLLSVCAILLFVLHSLQHPNSFGIIPIVSAEECSNLTQNLIQIHCSTQSF